MLKFLISKPLQTFMTNTAFQQAEYDMVNATYRQTIYFANGKTIDGYSKRIGFVEPIDPVNCLTNFILRMYIRGYLRECNDIDRVRYIEYHYNHTYEPIVRCFYEYPDFNPSVIEHQPRLVKWLSHFYEDASRLPLDAMQAKYHRRGRACEEFELDINQHGFIRPEHLVRKVVSLLRQGQYPAAHIGHFYRQCKEKYFPNLGYEKSEKYDAIVLKMLNRS